MEHLLAYKKQSLNGDGNKLLFYITNYSLREKITNIFLHLAWAAKKLIIYNLREQACATVKGFLYVFKKAEIPK